MSSRRLSKRVRGDIADPVTAKALNKCQQEIGKVADKFLRAKSKALQKCWDQRLKGLHAANCPDPGLGDGKTLAAIVKAEGKTRAAICNKCGGHDKLCGGVGEDADFTPTDIGFAATCPAVTVPFGGPACGGTVSTLQGLVDCVACVVEFRVDCIDSAQVPEFVPYPCECNP